MAHGVAASAVLGIRFLSSALMGSNSIAGSTPPEISGSLWQDDTTREDASGRGQGATLLAEGAAPDMKSGRDSH